MGNLQSLFLPMLATMVRDFILKHAPSSYMVKQKELQKFICENILYMWSVYSEDVGGDRYLISKLSSMFCSEEADINNIKLLLAELSKLYKDSQDLGCAEHSIQLSSSLISLKADVYDQNLRHLLK